MMIWGWITEFDRKPVVVLIFLETVGSISDVGCCMVQIRYCILLHSVNLNLLWMYSDTVERDSSSVARGTSR